MHIPVFLFLSNLFSSDMIIIVFVALLLFGGEKLPEIARGLGKGIREFKDASEGVKREINNQINSFDEKREEKKVEEAVAANQSSVVSPPPAADAPPAAIRPAENAIPVSDTHFSTPANNETENNEAVHAEQSNEHHNVGVSHTDAGTTTNETINNS